MYDDAIEILKSHNMPFAWGDDYCVDEENIISKELEKPVFVHRYQEHCKTLFYE